MHYGEHMNKDTKEMIEAIGLIRTALEQAHTVSFETNLSGTLGGEISMIKSVCERMLERIRTGR